MKKTFHTSAIIFTIIFAVLFFACHKDDHPTACFQVQNPIMLLGDTVRIIACGNQVLKGDWDMGDGTIYTSTYNTDTPKHVYKAKGTFTIKLTVKEHKDGWPHLGKRRTAETTQTVTVQ